MAAKFGEVHEQVILNQGQLQQRLKAHGLPISTNTIHACMDAGMPTMDIPGNRKPRFHWDQVWAWVINVQGKDPLRQSARDNLYLKMRGAR